MARATTRFAFVSALTVRIVAIVGLSVVGLLAFVAVVPAEVLRSNSDPVGDYLQTLGTIYAVLQAFVVFVVWTQFNDVRTLVEREASDIIDLFRTTQALPEPCRSSVRRRLVEYTACVLDVEWSAMRRHDSASLERTGSHLESAFGELSAFTPATERDAVLFAEALGRFNELSDVRTLRVTSSCNRVPLGLRILLDGGGLMIVASTWLFSVESLAIHIFITSAIAGLIAHIRFVVDDLDDPFSGDWQVPSDTFERARRVLEGAAAETPGERAPERPGQGQAKPG